MNNLTGRAPAGCVGVVRSCRGRSLLLVKLLPYGSLGAVHEQLDQERICRLGWCSSILTGKVAPFDQVIAARLLSSEPVAPPEPCQHSRIRRVRTRAQHADHRGALVAAAVAIRVLQLHRASEPTRGLLDELTGRLSRRLFIHHGKLFSTRYLFESPLWEVCRQTGLVTPNGKPTMTAHRFRHTVEIGRAHV